MYDQIAFTGKFNEEAWMKRALSETHYNSNRALLDHSKTERNIKRQSIKLNVDFPQFASF